MLTRAKLNLSSEYEVFSNQSKSPWLRWYYFFADFFGADLALDALAVGFAAGFALTFFGAVLVAAAFSFLGLAAAALSSVFEEVLVTGFEGESDFLADFTVLSFGCSGCFATFVGTTSALG